MGLQRRAGHVARAGGEAVRGPLHEDQLLARLHDRAEDQGPILGDRVGVGEEEVGEAVDKIVGEEAEEEVGKIVDLEEDENDFNYTSQIPRHFHCI